MLCKSIKNLSEGCRHVNTSEISLILQISDEEKYNGSMNIMQEKETRAAVYSDYNLYHGSFILEGVIYKPRYFFTRYTSARPRCGTFILSTR
jgi:hypothetical protein